MVDEFDELWADFEGRDGLDLLLPGGGSEGLQHLRDGDFGLVQLLHHLNNVYNKDYLSMNTNINISDASKQWS